MDQVRPSPVFPCGSSESVSVPSLGPQVPLPTVGSISRLGSHEAPWCTRLRDKAFLTVTACHTRAVQSPHRMELTSLVCLQGVQLLACANAPRKEAKKPFPGRLVCRSLGKKKQGDRAHPHMSQQTVQESSSLYSLCLRKAAQMGTINLQISHYLSRPGESPGPPPA